MPDSFFDSNTLIYTVSTNEGKAASARKLISAGGTISVQVLNEVANVARKKMCLDWPETSRLLLPFRTRLRIVPLTEAVHYEGIRLGTRYQFSVYDSMIVAAALSAGCETLWSEDMHDGLVVDQRLTIRNPFA